MGIGQGCIGLFVPFTLIPALPEMISSVETKFKGQNHAVNNLSAGIFNMMLGIGQMCAPFFAGFFTQNFSFRIMSDIVAIILVSFAFLYLILGTGCSSCIRTRKNYHHRNEDPKK
jgi:MFS family permease